MDQAKIGVRAHMIIIYGQKIGHNAAMTMLSSQFRQNVTLSTRRQNYFGGEMGGRGYRVGP